MSDGANSAKFKIAGLADRGNLLLKTESLVKKDAKISYSFRSRNDRFVKLNGFWKWHRGLQMLGNNKNHLCFVIVQLKFVMRHPGFYVRNALFRRRDDFWEIRNRARFVDLIVVRKTMVRERMMRHNLSDRLSVQYKENGSKDGSLGDTKLQGRRF